MRAVILAAGRGSRMKNLTEDRPKCLVEFRGRPLLEWQISSLQEAGIDEIAVVTGYKRELLAGRGLREFRNERWSDTNMVSSLECAREWLNEAPCIVSYSDIFYGPEAPRTLNGSDADLSVLYDVNWLAQWTKRFGDPLLDAETFRMDDGGNIVEIGNKPKSVEEIQGQYMGLLKFSPAGWAEVERLRSTLSAAERDSMHMTGTLQRIIEAGRIHVRGVPFGGEWAEMDSQEDLEAMNNA